MHRRLFLAGAAALVGAGVARASPLLLPVASGAVEAYAERLRGAIDRTGRGRFVFESEDALLAAHDRVRAEHGLKRLDLHTGLREAARAHAPTSRSAASSAISRRRDSARPNGSG